MSEPTPLLRLDGVHKSYGDVEVLRGVDLEVPAHKVICVIGASGCGKSTLLKCANLIEPINKGRILFEARRSRARTPTPTACAATSGSSSRRSTCSRI